MIIGLTGNIGSGKSTVSRYLKELGAEVIDTDYISRIIVEPGRPALQKIAETFGEHVLNNDGTLNRQALGDIVFKDTEAREKLNSIMLPLIIKEVDNYIHQYRNDRGCKAPALVVEAPLLFEAGMENSFDEVWLVTVDKQVQLQRIMERDGSSEEQAQKRIESQMPAEEKAKKAQRIIDNSASQEDTRSQVKKLWQNIVIKKTTE